MAESARQKRMRELGLTGETTPSQSESPQPAASGMSSRQKRMIQLGIVQQPIVDMGPDAADSQFRQEAQKTPTLQPTQEPQTDPGAADSAFRKEEIINKEYPTDYPGGILNPINNINRFQRSPVGNVLRNLQRGAGEAMGLSGEQLPYADTTGSDIGDTATKYIGAGLGYAINPASLEQGPITTAYNNPLVQTAAAKIGGMVGNPIASRVAQGITREGAAGAVLGGMNALNSGRGDAESLAEGVGGGAVIGGALGGLGPVAGKGLKALGKKYNGTKLGDFLNGFFDNAQPAASDQLALPIGRRDERLNAASERSNLPYGNDPVTNEYQFKLPEASPQTVTRMNNIKDTQTGLTEIESELNNLQSKYQQAVQEQYALLKTSRDGRGGITQGQLHTDANGDVVGRTGRISNNPEWYQRFYAENGKVPSNRDLYRLAQKHVDEGYQNDGVQIPSWKSENGFDETVNALTSVRDQVRQGLRDLSPGMTDSPLKENVLGFKPKAKTINPSLKPESLRGETVPQPTLVTPADMPLTVPKMDLPAIPSNPIVQPQKMRGFTETLINSKKTAPGLRDKLKSAYTEIPNEISVAQANKRVNDNLESAASFVVSKSPLSAEKVTTAHRVIDEFSKAGNFERANDVADKIAAELTKAGQSIQAASIYNRLTPEGILVHATRIAQRINEKLPITAKEVKVTPDMAAQITDLAHTTQKMTGVKDLSNDVMNILEKAKTGEKLTDTEAAALKNFVEESKQFVKETTRKTREPRPPQEPKDKRVRDNVVSFLDAQEQAAKERLRARGIQISSTPLDVWADYAIIGAAKMGKGTIKFGDWSEAMIKDLGESIRPQLQQLYERSVQAYNQSKNVVTKQTISDAEKLAEKVVANKEITGPQADSIRSLAKKVSRLSGDEKILASQDLQRILQTLDRPGILKKISSTQTIGQLLNPKTQVRNAVGNELFYRVERLNKIVSTPIDIVRSKITGGERTVTFKTNNQGEYWKNWMRGLKAGWNGVNINGLQTAYDLGSPAFRAKWNPLTYMEKSLGAALKSFDTAAYMRAYNNTVGELSTLRALNEGKRGDKDLIAKYIREADDNVMKIADEYGRYVTFQDNNAISKGLVATKRGLNLGKDFGLGDLVLKYPKTPGAILMRALEYSPAGFIRSASIMARPWFKKEPNTKEATEALTRAMIGTFGFSGLGYFLMDKGIVTGSASKDKDVRDLQKTAGQGQYQVNLSALSRFVQSGFDLSSTKLQEGDQMYTYDWMQPISVAASMGANVAKNMREGKSKLEGLAGTAYNSAEGGLSTLTEQSVLSGLKNATQINPGQTVTDKIVDILTDIPSSFVPTYLNQAKQLTDNSTPETFSPDKLERGLNKAKAKIPGIAGELPKQFSALGEQKAPYQNNSAFNVMFNPGFSSNYKLSPEAKYVVDLMNESNDESVAPRVPGKKITVNGQSMQLNGDQYSRLQELQGQEQKNRISKLKGTGSLNSRVNNAQDALTKAGSDARKKLVKEFPELNPPKAAK